MSVAANRPIRGLSAGLFLAVAVAFAPVVAGGFVNWDDPQNFLENPHYRGVGPAQIRWAWTTAHLGVYQPLGWLFWGAEFALFGLSAGGYHLTSVLLHGLCTVALYGLARDILARCDPHALAFDPRAASQSAAIASLLFAVHPLRVEVVAWVSCQSYLPCAALALLSTRAYLWAHPPGDESGRPRLGWWLASFGLYTAAALTKAPVISLPAVLLILDAYPLRRFGPGRGRVWACLLEKLPFFAVAAALSAVAVVARESGGSPIPVPRFDFPSRLAMACYGVAFALVRTLAPFGLAAHYPLPAAVDWREPPFLASIGIVGVLSVLTIRLRRRWPGLLAGWASVLVLLAPGVNLVFVEPRLMKDRSTYLASLAGAVVMAAGLLYLAGKSTRRRTGLVAAGLLLAGCLTFQTWTQASFWRDSVALWARVLAVGGRPDVLVHTNYGEALAERGLLSQALEQYRAAVSGWPDSAEAHNGLGVVLKRLGRNAEARDRFEEAIRLDPRSAEAHNNLGLILAIGEDLDGAIRSFREAIRLEPGLAEAHTNLGQALMLRGEFAEASGHFATALRLRPDDPRARSNLARALGRLGDRPAILERATPPE